MIKQSEELKVTNWDAYMIDGIRVLHQFCDTESRFAHRITVGNKSSRWYGYTAIAQLTFARRMYVATTAAYDGTFSARIFEMKLGRKVAACAKIKST